MLLRYTHELPMGHRLQDHKGLCKFAHGHGYFITVRMHGIPDKETGMIVDFSEFKQAIRSYFFAWDHAFALQKGDPLCAALRPFAKLIELDAPPTAECLALRWRADLQTLFPGTIELTVFETRDCSVEVK
jgi:6-pyruvoyl-tetrahydropterin synthase